MRGRGERAAGRAMLNLGVLLHRQLGESDQGRRWIARAAEAGEPKAMFALGTFLEDIGRAEEAMPLYMRAAGRCEVDAANWLGSLSEQRGDLDSAMRWWHQAAEGGQVNAMVSVAQHLVVNLKDVASALRRRDSPEGPRWGSGGGS